MKLDNRMLIIAATFGAAAAIGACSGSDDNPSPVVRNTAVDGGARKDVGIIGRVLRPIHGAAQGPGAGHVVKPVGPLANLPGVATHGLDGGATSSTDASTTKPPTRVDAGSKPDAAPPAPTACESCVVSSCATESSACAGDTNCACWQGCFDDTNLNECMQKCGVAGTKAMAYVQCRDGKCLSDCNSSLDGGLPGLDASLPPFDGGFTLDGGAPFDASFSLPDATLTPDAAIFNLDGGSPEECNACLASNCASQGSACQADADCACWQGCYDGSNWIACSQKCGAGNNAWFGQLGCRFQSCSQACR